MLRSFTIVILVFAAFAIWTVYFPEKIEEPVAITVEQGATVDSIIELLSENDIISNELFAKAYVRLQGLGSKLQAGEYTFDNTISLASVFERLTSAQNPHEVTLTFIEGWTIDDMADYVANQEELSITREAFIAATRNDYAVSFAVVIPEGRDLEGYLFPDTYRVFKDITADALVEKMLNTFEEKITGTYLTEIDREGRDLDEIVILASILERELLTLDERKNGADVFLKRLKDGIALQADSTVNYITKKKTSRASLEDIAIDSPYNTYKYRGLPPGPIGNPGLDSIEAAIFPTTNPYYYFLTTPDGEALFNETLEGHNADKRRHYP